MDKKNQADAPNLRDIPDLKHTQDISMYNPQKTM